jgi:ribosome-associated protein
MNGSGSDALHRLKVIGVGGLWLASLSVLAVTLTAHADSKPREHRGQLEAAGKQLPVPGAKITNAMILDDRHTEERFVRASGPGGQNVNKVATAVELRFNVRASSLPLDVKERLVALAGTRMTSDGVLLIDSRKHRTQAQNRAAARERLLVLIQKAMVRLLARRPTRARKGAREARLTSKKLRGTIKDLRGRARSDDD